MRSGVRSGVPRDRAEARGRPAVRISNFMPSIVREPVRHTFDTYYTACSYTVPTDDLRYPLALPFVLTLPLHSTGPGSAVRVYALSIP